MNNGCSHELKARQIRRHNVNKEFLLAYLSGRRWAKLTHRKPVKQTVMGESICWLYINTSVMSNRARQADRERERFREGDTGVSKCVYNQSPQRTKKVNIIIIMKKAKT